jgi:hypothetical protein
MLYFGALKKHQLASNSWLVCMTAMKPLEFVMQRYDSADNNQRWRFNIQTGDGRW